MATSKTASLLDYLIVRASLREITCVGVDVRVLVVKTTPLERILDYLAIIIFTNSS